MSAPVWADGGEPSADEERLRWRSRGEGPPLVLLHKLGGWIGEWEAVAPLIQGRRVIALDSPGHGGGAGAPPYVQPVDDSARKVLNTLDALGIQDFALVGTSNGGAVAIDVAARAGRRVTALFLISVALTPPSSIEAMQAADAPADGTLYGPGDRPLPRSFEVAAQLFGFGAPEAADDMNRSRAAAGPWVRAAWRGAILADVVGKLPAITAPTVLIYGERGGEGYAKHEATGLARLPKARAVCIPDAGAFTHQDQPAATAAVINGALA